MYEEKRAQQQVAAQQQLAAQQHGHSKRSAVSADDMVRNAPASPAAAVIWEAIMEVGAALGLTAFWQDIRHGTRIIRIATANTAERMILLPQSNVSAERVREMHLELKGAGVDALWLVLAPPHGVPARLPVTDDEPPLAWARVGISGVSEVMHADGTAEPFAAVFVRWLRRGLHRKGSLHACLPSAKRA